MSLFDDFESETSTSRLNSPNRLRHTSIADSEIPICLAGRFEDHSRFDASNSLSGKYGHSKTIGERMQHVTRAIQEFQVPHRTVRLVPVDMIHLRVVELVRVNIVEAAGNQSMNGDRFALTVRTPKMDSKVTVLVRPCGNQVSS